MSQMIFADMTNEELLDNFAEAAFENHEVGEEGNHYRQHFNFLKRIILEKLNANS